jgi:3-oxoadipate enol-lactonase
MPMSASPAACRLDYELSGPAGAPVVVLSPSLGTDRSMWADQVDPLSERFRVLRYDLRGHGASPAPPGPYSLSALGADLLALLDRLEIDHASLCGVSIGGMISIWVAANAPDRVRRLAVCCTSAHLDPDGSYRERAATVRARGLEEIAEASLARWFTPGFARAHPERLRQFREVLVSLAPEGYAGCCEAIAAMDLRHDLASVRAPTLVMAGRDDPATPPEHGRLIADGIRHARFELIDDAAHLANVEQPERVGALILTHLQSTEEEPR